MKKWSKLQKRIYYCTIYDGLTDIFQAFLLLFASLLFLTNWTSFLFSSLIIALIITNKTIIKSLKIKFIYPRIGIVEISEKQQKFLIWSKKLGICVLLLLGIIFGLLIITFKWSINETYQNLPVFIGCIFLGKFSMQFHFTNQIYYLLIGIGSFMIGIGFTIFPFQQGNWNMILFTLIEFMVIATTGLIKTISFFRKYPSRTINEGF